LIKLLLLHGMGGGPEDFRFLIDRYPLARALTLDQSDFAAASDFVTQQIKTFQPQIVCGYSMGGRIALHALSFLRSQEHQIGLPLGLLLVSAGMGLKSAEEVQARKVSDQDWIDLLESDPEAFWVQWYSQPLFSLGERAADAAGWLSRRRATQVTETKGIGIHLRRFGPSEHHYLLPDLLELKNLGISTLYMAGERDKKYADLAMELALRGIPTKMVADAGHALPLEKPEAILEVIETWEKDWSKNGKKY